MGRNSKLTRDRKKKQKQKKKNKSQQIKIQSIRALKKALPYIERKRKEYLENQRLHKNLYGKVKEPITVDFNGNRIVAVNNQIYYSSTWKTFPDFLNSYMPGILGKEWGENELSKPLEQRHQILKWYDALCRYEALQKADEDGIYRAEPCGAATCWYRLAYDLYTHLIFNVRH